MAHSSLENLIKALEQGTNIHIAVAFFGDYGNRLTHRLHSQMIHEAPVCLACKTTQEGLAACYRCRRLVERKARRYKRSFGGYCTKGVYEYCRPILFDDRIIGVVFIGNILTDDPAQRKRLFQHIGPEMLESMEQNYTEEDCIRTADVLESYITFLFDKYGNENKNYDPLLENIKNYIRENIASDVTLAELASVFNYNEKYLGHLFKSRAGYTVKGYCNYVRVGRAKHLLTDTNISVANIAQQLGYSNVTYFDRVFRYFTGVSPRVYRSGIQKNHQQNVKSKNLIY